jgi:cardiolipin synthase
MASRSYQPELLRSGVRVFRYQGAFLHGKTLVLDDDLSAVGSANVDIRSFRLNFEVNCYVMSTALTASLTELYEQQCRQSREVTLAEVENRSVAMRLVEAVVHLLSPLL